MARKPFNPDDLSVIIPYRDLECLLNIAKDLEEMKKLYRQQELRYAAMQDMFRECMEKISEINRYL